MGLVPVVSVVGKSGSGKTTLLEKLIAELKSRGYRLATIKHDTHGFSIDVPGKDTWRFTQAGSDVVLISSPVKYAVVRSVGREQSLSELTEVVGDGMDIILTEGYKGAAKPKIEVLRSERSTELLCSPDELVAIVSDLRFPVNVPQFDLDDHRGVADLLQERFIRPRREAAL